MTSVATSESAEFAFRVLEAAGPNAWLVLVTDGVIHDVARTLSTEISTLGDEPATMVEMNSAADLETFMQAHPDGIVILTGMNQFADSDWRRLDLNRTRLQRSGTTVLVLHTASVEQLENKAPNLASWIGGSIWRLSDARPLDGASTKQRLIALRQWSGLEDLDVIRLAEAGSLPPDPEYAEWLTLLERGDLLAK